MYTLEHKSRKLQLHQPDTWQLVVTQNVRCSQITVFCDVTPCSLAEIYWRFAGTYCLHLRGTRVKTEVVCSSIMSLNVYQTTRRHIENDGSRHSHHPQNPKSYFYILMTNDPGFHKKIIQQLAILWTCFTNSYVQQCNLWLDYGRNNRTIVVLLPVGATHFSPLLSVQTGSKT